MQEEKWQLLRLSYWNQIQGGEKKWDEWRDKL